MARFWGNDTQGRTISLSLLRADRGRHQTKRSPDNLLKFLGSLTGWCLVSSPLAAQIIPDSTLGTQVNTSDNVAEITGGTAAGSNLFHSFQDFSVETGNTAFFNNALGINNIIGRVTGNNLSNLDGLMRANGTANLILINPNGINIGGNASLDIGGSFLGSTATSVIFEDGTVFNADLSTKPLLTISAPLGLQLGQNSAAIQVAGGNNANANLEVTSGNTFALVGNGITFNSGVVTAESGRIELGSVAQGQVSISNLAAGWQLGYEGVTQFGELQLLAGSSLLNANSLANPDGEIQVQGSKITLERSQISAPTLADNPGADITIRATDSLSLQGTTGSNLISGSQIVSEVSPTASGSGGAINIETGQLNIDDRSWLSTMTFGSGTGGNINILAGNINITGTGFVEFQRDFQNAAFIGTLLPSDRTTGIFTGTAAAGTSGNLMIDASSLNLNNGAVIFSPVFTTGTGGNLNIAVPEIQINASAIQTGTRGNLESAAAGDINLETKRLQIQDGATILNITFANAAAGKINLTASESIELSNTPPGALLMTGIYANSSFGLGTGGEINIDTNQLKMNNSLIVSNSGSVLADGTIVSAGGKGGNISIQADESIEAGGLPANPAFTSGIGTSTYSASDAGNLTISTGKLTIRDGVDFASATVGSGQGGQLTINATDSIELIGTTSNQATNRGGLLATSGRREFPSAEATGASGNISVTTPELSVRDGASIDVQSLGSGDAGNLDIIANSISISNRANLSASTIFGVGGGITINTNTLKLDRGLINASVLGSGTGGNIEITARDSVEVIGSGFEFIQALLFDPSFLSPESLANLEIDLISEGILAATTGDGKAGTIAIQTADLQVKEGGLIATATAGEGGAGSIFLDASKLRLDASIVSASTLFAGQGGDIAINTDQLKVLAGGQVTTSTLGSGNSGDLTINAAESVTVSGASANNVLFSNITVGAQPLPTTTGNGGDLTITTDRLNIEDRGAISIGSTGTGNAGRLQIDANSIFFNRQGSISANTQSGGGGNIFLDAENIIWRGGSFTTATAAGSGNGGNIFIKAKNLVALEASRITADAFMGMGGNVQVNAQSLFICGECQISASSQLGVDGVVAIETLEPPNTLDSFDIPQRLTQPQEAVAVACPSAREANISQLTVTGRGGLPQRPQELLSGNSLVEFDDSTAQAQSPSVSQTTLPAPARSWYKDTQGTVVLTAQAAGMAPNNSATNSVDCHDLVP
ncbi:MAG: filamentous hemagglutinin N-terminal domain-containing protein [Pleurocapsa sp.]